MREEANAVSDSLSMVESQTEIQEENLEIVELQKTLIGIIQKMICKIQKNSNIDLDPFKNIVKPAFIEKKMQFRNLVKIWSKDFNEKRDLLIQLNEALNKDSKEKKDLVTQESFEEVLETKEYMKKIKTQIDIAVKNQKEIKEYIKTKEEKKKEIDAEYKKITNEINYNDGINYYIKDENGKYILQNGKILTVDGNLIAKLNLKGNPSIKCSNCYIKNDDKTAADAAVKAAANKTSNLDPFAGGRTTRKFSSLISQKTRRRKQTSR